MSVIDDLKRLERAGSESSKATEKLIDAAKNVLFFVMNTVARTIGSAHGPTLGGDGLKLPMGYNIADEKGDPLESGGYVLETVVRKGGSILYGPLLDTEDESISGYVMSRESALTIAKDVADGLLKEIAVCLEDRAKGDDSQAEALDFALEEAGLKRDID